ncbi:terminase small subunit [uncultured Mitsuokella sp.]|uniref:terminase small subunit n=1 Tax=uncultured Mitsuokella sp. TaxID=453120 RepID=UPI002591C984|nr:terminase small subunit [uncultured Mitsuokella sp.]
MKLTEKQRRFVDYYVETGNKTEAAKKAGYSEKTAASIGDENLRKPAIKAAIDARLRELEGKRIAKADEVMQFLTSTLRGEVKEERVVVEGTGEGRSDARIITVQVSARDRLEAAKSLLKRYPMQLDAKEQKLKLQKLENEIRAATESNQAAGKEPLVRIYLPDNGRGDNA